MGERWNGPGLIGSDALLSRISAFNLVIRRLRCITTYTVQSIRALDFLSPQLEPHPSRVGRRLRQVMALALTT
jgi:hypothetical protein